MRRYTPGFPEMMYPREINLSRLCRLLSHNDAPGKAVGYQVTDAQCRLTIAEPTRYTTLVTIEQTVSTISYWSLPSVTMCLCHDAVVAEVYSSRQVSRLRARYDYPNKKLHQRDERHQTNQFLMDQL